jgi:phosphotransferase system enzyme I (PtsI)
MPLSYSGLAVSRGIAIGKVRLQLHGQVDIVRHTLAADSIESEVARFAQALEGARQELQSLRQRIPDDTPQDIAAFIDTHLLMLEDSTLSAIPIDIIRQQHCNAEWALKLQQDALVQVFDAMDDPYLKTRRDDVEHVVQRIQQRLLDQEPPGGTSESLDSPVVVAIDLSPADLLQLHHQGVAAIVTERGGPLSHTAIIARSLGLPALVGVSHIHQYLHNGETVVVDANNATVLSGLDQSELVDFAQEQAHERHARRKLTRLRHEPARSRDGVTITLRANIELLEDITAMQRTGADGVGLYRTEFLYLNRSHPPDEEEQLKAYRATLKRLKGAPLTIRTLDLGADKGIIPGSANCNNPALGLRAVRFCLKEPELFRTQLRAILRASAYGQVRLLIPMLTSLEELEQVLTLIDEQKNRLQQSGQRFDPELPLGAMIEVPAAALCADLFARRLDFLSIGTNDLIQYTLAIDRVDDAVSYLYDPLHPSVIRLVKHVIDAAKATRTSVGMCGEMAGDARFTPLLLGLGLREFSMHPGSLLEVKDRVRHCELRRLSEVLPPLLDDLENIPSQELLARLQP